MLEKAVLIGLITPTVTTNQANEYLEELAFLAKTAGANLEFNQEFMLYTGEENTDWLKRTCLYWKSELSKIFKATQEKGLTCIPTKVFWKDNLIKLKISLGQGKSKFDKRESIKRKEWEREKNKASKFNSNFLKNN